MATLALSSVRESTYANWHLVVVDDGSTVPIKPICDDILRLESSKVTVVRVEDSVDQKIRQGGSRFGSYWNQALKDTDADLAIMLCDDDALRADYLENLNIWFRENPARNYCHSSVRLFDPLALQDLDMAPTRPHLQFLGEIVPQFNVDAAQVAWRVQCNREDQIWFPSPQTKDLDASLFSQLYDKYGPCPFTGFQSQLKGWGDYCLRVKENGYEATDRAAPYVHSIDSETPFRRTNGRPPFGEAVLALTAGYGADLGCGVNPIPNAAHLVDCDPRIKRWQSEKTIHVRDIDKGFDDWPTDHFDFVFTRNLFEMLTDQPAFLRTCLRVTKPGGKVIIGTMDHRLAAKLMAENGIPFRLVDDESGTYFVVEPGAGPGSQPEVEARHRRGSYRIYAPPSPWPITANPPLQPRFEALSVVIAFHNKAEMTADCVESIFADFPGCEVILVDNGSDQDSKDAVAKRLGQRVRLIHNGENKGCAVAWNAGLKLASGDLLSVLNNDILVMPGGIRKLADSAWKVGISCFNSGNLDANLTFIGSSHSSHGASYPEGSALFFRRDVWEDVGPFDEGMILAYCEDSEWGLRARLKGYGWETCPDTLIHFGQVTSASVAGCGWFHAQNHERLRTRYRGLGAGEKIVVRISSGSEAIAMAAEPLKQLRQAKPLAHIQLVVRPDQAQAIETPDYLDSIGTECAADRTQLIDLDTVEAASGMPPMRFYAERLGVSAAN